MILMLYAAAPILIIDQSQIARPRLPLRPDMCAKKALVIAFAMVVLHKLGQCATQ